MFQVAEYAALSSSVKDRFASVIHSRMTFWCRLSKKSSGQIIHLPIIHNYVTESCDVFYGVAMTFLLLIKSFSVSYTHSGHWTRYKKKSHHDGNLKRCLSRALYGWMVSYGWWTLCLELCQWHSTTFLPSSVNLLSNLSKWIFSRPDIFTSLTWKHNRFRLSTLTNWMILFKSYVPDIGGWTTVVHNRNGQFQRQ